MRRPHVAVVGGGLAGLAAGLACADAGARVSLFEARPRLGGATFSTQRHGLEIDNGQHVFLRCCEHYRGFLTRLGVAELTHLQPRLAVALRAPGGRRAWIRRRRLPHPLQLAPSLLRFPWLPFGQRLRAARTLQRLAALDREAAWLDTMSFGDWLRQHGESEVAIAGFWDLFVRATLNLAAADASLQLAAVVFQTGLLEDAAGGDLGWSRVPLGRLHAAPAAEALRKAGAAVHLRSPVAELGSTPDGVELRVGGARILADTAILATPHEAAARLLPVAAGIDPESLSRLGRSPIVNLHVVLERRVMQEPCVAGFGSPLQWIFDRSEGAGLGDGQYLVVSLSDARDWLGRPQAEQRARFEAAFAALFPEARGARATRFFATAEPAATFRQAPGARALRPGPVTRAPGLFLAGAWTDTGWPATMEGAVRSGLAAARRALLHTGIHRGLPAGPPLQESS